MKIKTGTLPNLENSRKFLDGSNRSFVKLNSSFIGLGTYKPGWQWSLHAGKQTGKSSESHIGYIVSGTMTVKDSEGNEKIINPGDAFEVGPNHDAWVSGKEACIALDFTHIQNN